MASRCVVLVTLLVCAVLRKTKSLVCNVNNCCLFLSIFQSDMPQNWVQLL